MKHRIIDRLQDFEALREAWAGLERGAALPMQQFIWNQAAAATFARDGQLRVVVVEDGGDVRAIAPLVQRNASPYLEILGMFEMYEPSNAVWADDDSLRFLSAAIAGLGVPFFLRRLPADSPFAEALGAGFRGRGMMLLRCDGSSPRLSLDSGWAEPESKSSAGLRARLRRARRIAEERGEVSVEMLSPTPAALGPLLEEAFGVEAANWKGKSGTALLSDPMRAGFFRRYAASASEKGVLRLSFLRIGGRVAAMLLGVETASRFWMMKIGYDERFAQCSPGYLMIREIIRSAAMRGLKSVEFMGEIEAWKREWTREETSTVSLRGYPWGVRGGARLAMDITRYVLRKLVMKRGIYGRR